MNESFADVYGLMMVLETSGHDPRAVVAGEEILKYRLLSQAMHEELYITERHKRKSESLGGAWDTHFTTYTLQETLRARNQWRGKNPDELKQIALELATKNLLYLFNPGVNWKQPGKLPYQKDESWIQP